MEIRVWIILGAVLGFLMLTFTAVMVLFSWKRSKRRIRGFSLRAVTPLDDAEFESWRRPSQYTTRPEKEKYIITPTQRAIVRNPKSPNMFDKELSSFDSYQTTPPQSPTQDPSSPIRLPEQARRKSSVISIADRPPTPYSPSPTSGEFPRRSSRGSMSSRISHGSHRHRHYPSMSEASDFNFDFGFDSPPRGGDRNRARATSQSEKPLCYSVARYEDV
jgi:hypothetical protein